MKKRNIIHVLKGKANPNTMNGVNKVVHSLASTQLQQGHNVEVWGITDTPEQVAHQHDYPLRLFKANRNRFATNKKMIRMLDELESDTIFHLHSVFLPELYALSRQLKKRELKWVLSPHGGYAPESLKKNAWVKKIYKTLFEKRLIHDAAAIHAIGEYGEADQFHEDVLKCKVGLVPNGYMLTDRCKSGYATEGPLRLCYCGRLAMTHKGLDILLEGLAMAHRHGTQVVLDLIGDGPDRKLLELRVISLGLADCVTFHGVKMGEEKDTLIQQADVFVHTSRWDGIPTSLLEAAGLGLPLLVSCPTNMADYVASASAGYVIEDLTTECIARQIAQAASEKKSSKLSSKGLSARRMVTEKFTWDRIARLLDDSVYLKVVG